ncbi:hypothetical protein T484DRAFT_1878174, partial [Baffinella frigidus]
MSFFMSKEDKARLAAEEEAARLAEEQDAKRRRAEEAREQLLCERSQFREDAARFSEGKSQPQAFRSKSVNPFLLKRAAPAPLAPGARREGGGCYNFTALIKAMDQNPDQVSFPKVAHVNAPPRVSAALHGSAVQDARFTIPEKFLESKVRRALEEDAGAWCGGSVGGGAGGAGGAGGVKVAGVKEGEGVKAVGAGEEEIAAVTGYPVEEVRALVASLRSRAERLGGSDSRLWTDAARPGAVSKLCGNRGPASELRRWLAETRNKPREVDTARVKVKGRTLYAEDSGSDSEDEDVPKNAAILVGPHGCGKTAAAHAACEELQLGVIEINPSDRRTGRAIMTMVGEATRSKLVVLSGNSDATTFGLKAPPSASSAAPVEAVPGRKRKLAEAPETPVQPKSAAKGAFSALFGGPKVAGKGEGGKEEGKKGGVKKGVKGGVKEEEEVKGKGGK